MSINGEGAVGVMAGSVRTRGTTLVRGRIRGTGLAKALDKKLYACILLLK
jgi:hypothetical protein